MLLWPVAVDNSAMETEPSKAEPPKRKRRWYQFSLRSLLVFTAVIAVTCGWLGKRTVRKQIEQSAINALRRKGPIFTSYDYRTGPNATPPGPRWARWLLGDNYFREVEIVNLSGPRFEDEDLTNVREFPYLSLLALLGTKNITDAGLANLRGLTHLKSLHIENSRLRGEGFANLTDLPELRELYLVQIPLTDSGLEHLKPLRSFHPCGFTELT